MPKGITLAELMLVLAIAAVLTALGLPRLRGLQDWIATDHATREVTTALAVGRHGAVMHGTRTRVRIAADTLRIDRLEGDRWEPWWRRPGPASLAVRLEVSNPVVTFGPIGLGWGAANTKVVLRRGSQVETITVSRLGRVKRW